MEKTELLGYLDKRIDQEMRALPEWHSLHTQEDLAKCIGKLSKIIACMDLHDEISGSTSTLKGDKKEEKCEDAKEVKALITKAKKKSYTVLKIHYKENKKSKTIYCNPTREATKDNSTIKVEDVTCGSCKKLIALD
jgi:hypothetical protein